MTLLPVLIAFIVAAACTAWLSSNYSPLKILDNPNERSLHETPVHRTGGLGLLTGLLAGVLVAISMNQLAIPATSFLAPVVILLVISFLDDLKGVSILTRLAAQILVAILAVSSLLEQSWLLIIPVAIAIVWMINLYNFMDGMDGFAGGMAVWGFGFLSLIAYTQGAPDAALVCALIAVASTGFLLFNFPPARIFMGDAGSTLIGFFAAIAILYFHVNQLLFAGLGILIFSPFIVDATVTLLRRILKGERFWQAHRSHYYQRLVQAGWGHRNTVLAEYGLMALTGICALMVMNRPDLYWPVLTGWLLGYAAVMQVLERTVLRRA